MSIAKAKLNLTEISAVPLLDLKAQYAPIQDEVEAAIRGVCETQHFVMGPNVLELEERIAEYSRVENGIGVSSGTDALLVALMALDIGQGDEVITTPFTFFATGGTIARLGARPIFCDIEPDTYNLDPSQVRNFLELNCRRESGVTFNKTTGGKVRAIMPVHLFGQVADMASLEELAKEFNLYIVEDAAQAIGAEDVNGRRAGSIGDIGCFSFFPSKNLGAFGDGGMCVTRDAELAEKIRTLRVHGGKPKYFHRMVGGNFRLDAIQAAILLVKLKYLDGWTRARQENAAYFDDTFSALGLDLSPPTIRSGGRHIYNQYTIRVPDRDGLREHLGDKNIGSEIYYPVPLHLQDCFGYLGYAEGDCPHAEQASHGVVSLPIYPELTQAHRDYVVDACKEYLAT